MIIFVTGKSGSGKSMFSKHLANKLNYNYINVDEISHLVFDDANILEKAYNLFGLQINDEYGRVDRKKLGQIAFGEKDSSRVKEFNQICWEYMQKILDDKIVDNCVVDWALLPISKYWTKNAIKILIKPQNDNLRIKKIMLRDNISKDYIKLRDSAGIKYNENEFNLIIKNNYNTDFADEISKIAKHIASIN